MQWEAKPGDSALRLLSAVDLGFPDNRCNDAKVDAKGRLWFGTNEYDSKRIFKYCSKASLQRNGEWLSHFNVSYTNLASR